MRDEGDLSRKELLKEQLLRAELQKKTDWSVQRLREVKGPIKIIAHYDSDGLSAALILIKALQREGRSFSVSFVKHLDTGYVEQLAREQYNSILFADVGSSSQHLLTSLLKQKIIFIIDHHLSDEHVQEENMVHLNPYDCGYADSGCISGAGMCYLFAKTLNIQNKDLACYGIVGASGDQQLYVPSVLHNELLQDAVETNTLMNEGNIRIFPETSWSIDKMLEFSTEVFIPGVSGNTIGTLEFLSKLGLEREGTLWPKYANLTEQQKKTLNEGVARCVVQNGRGSGDEGLFRSYYMFPEAYPLRTVEEVTLLLDACGRLGKPEQALGFLLKNKKLTKEALVTLQIYKREMMKAIQWIIDNKNNEKKIGMYDACVIINAGEEIPDSIVGSLSNVLVHTQCIPISAFLLFLARTKQKTTKVSLRCAGVKGVNVREILNRLVSVSGGFSGGHSDRAGGVIPQDKEEMFIACAKEVFMKRSKEEAIIPQG